MKDKGSLTHFGSRLFWVNLEERELEVYRIDGEELYSKGRQKARADARGVFCYWAVRELGVKGIQMAKRLHMSQPGRLITNGGPADSNGQHRFLVLQNGCINRKQQHPLRTGLGQQQAIKRVFMKQRQRLDRKNMLRIDR